MGGQASEELLIWQEKPKESASQPFREFQALFRLRTGLANTGSRRQRLRRWSPAPRIAKLRDNSREFRLLAAAPEPSRWAAQKKMNISQGDITIAIEIMREAASWLIETGKPLWRLEDLTEQKLLAGISKEDIYVGWVANEAAAAMILQWNDPFFWPQVKDDSGFIHKLVVRRHYSGTGISRQMVEWAKQEAQRRGKDYLRLDCAGDRPKLCSFYERIGFRQVDRRMVGPFDEAFYEMRLVKSE